MERNHPDVERLLVQTDKPVQDPAVPSNDEEIYGNGFQQVGGIRRVPCGGGYRIVRRSYDQD